MASLKGAYKFLIAGGIAAAAVSAALPIAVTYLTNPTLSQDTVKIRATTADSGYDIFVRNTSSEPLDLIEVRLVSPTMPTFTSPDLLALAEIPESTTETLNAAPETTAVYSLGGQNTRVRLRRLNNRVVVVLPVLQAIESGGRDRFTLRHDGIEGQFDEIVFTDIFGNSYVARIAR
ncbi:hypothetical protein [Shimia sp.]|uniref:hypothetical protein n=1 Tax=Shimia sp. TaxID=1954381 RepID=UPI0032985C20